ncbi:MAG: hypothetical protein IKY24_07295 [Alistipes sp.]|nr:hypothetical protein [Alistipes sp.]
MKKIFTTLTAAFIALSCATDATEGIRFDEQSFVAESSITLSLEGSRTQLGERVGEGFPLFWSEGDKISANGIESAEAVIDENNLSRATFNFSEELNGTLNIAYPAAPAGKVLFAENQLHAGNSTFGNGVSTMYGVATNEGVELKHLTGVLKIGIVGSATLTKVQISTADETPISGTFNCDFASGTITPTAEAKSVITYSFGEGVQLSSTPTYVHIALPAGEYSLLRMRLYDSEGGIMVAEVRAPSSKPIKAGFVREF